MKVRKVTTIIPESSDTARDLRDAVNRVGDGAIAVFQIVDHHDPFSDEQHVEIVFTETLP